MPLAKCKRCDGMGHFTDPYPRKPGILDWCAGCGGDGKVQVAEPDALCQRCGGKGQYIDPHPTIIGVINWCIGCAGTGYAQ